MAREKGVKDKIETAALRLFVERAAAGQRVALNLPGLERRDLARHDSLERFDDPRRRDDRVGGFVRRGAVAPAPDDPDLELVHRQSVGDQAPVTTPPEPLRAHDGDDPIGGEGDQRVERVFERRRLHVVRVAAERFERPARVRRLVGRRRRDVAKAAFAASARAATGAWGSAPYNRSWPIPPAGSRRRVSM